MNLNVEIPTQGAKYRKLGRTVKIEGKPDDKSQKVESATNRNYAKPETVLKKNMEDRLSIMEVKRQDAINKQQAARCERMKILLSQLQFIEEDVREIETMVEMEIKRSKPT